MRRFVVESLEYLETFGVDVAVDGEQELIEALNVQMALEHLDNESRRALEMHADGVPLQAIARELKRSRREVEVLLREAIMRMRSLLGEERNAQR